MKKHYALWALAIVLVAAVMMEQPIAEASPYGKLPGDHVVTMYPTQSTPGYVPAPPIELTPPNTVTGITSADGNTITFNTSPPAVFEYDPELKAYVGSFLNFVFVDCWLAFRSDTQKYADIDPHGNPTPIARSIGNYTAASAN